MMRGRGKILIWTVIALMSAVTLFQTIAVLTHKPAVSADAEMLLYDVSLFQMEFLSSFISEAVTVSDTGRLNGLKLAAYSVEYTHHKLVEAAEGAVPELKSVSGLMEWIVRLQIGGDRKLRADEQEVFAALDPLVQQIYEAYANLYAPSGETIGTSVEKIHEADAKIVEILASRIQ